MKLGKGWIIVAVLTFLLITVAQINNSDKHLKSQWSFDLASDNLTSDPNIRIYRTANRISESETMASFFPSSDPRFYKAELGKVGADLVEGIIKIPGIKQVDIGPYILIVQKGIDADWKDIEGAVLHFLKKAKREIQE